MSIRKVNNKMDDENVVIPAFMGPSGMDLEGEWTASWSTSYLVIRGGQNMSFKKVC